MKQTLGGIHRHQRRYFHAAAGFSEDQDIAGITAEFLDIVTHPFEGLNEIKNARIA